MNHLSPAAQEVCRAYGAETGGSDAILASELRGISAALRAAALIPDINRLRLFALAEELDADE